MSTRRRITRIHVNMHIIKDNRKTGARNPALTVKDYEQNRKATEAIIHNEFGDEAARVVYRPDNPLPCGAVCWIETRNKVTVL